LGEFPILSLTTKEYIFSILFQCYNQIKEYE